MRLAVGGFRWRDAVVCVWERERERESMKRLGVSNAIAQLHPPWYGEKIFCKDMRVVLVTVKNEHESNWSVVEWKLSTLKMPEVLNLKPNKETHSFESLYRILCLLDIDRMREANAKVQSPEISCMAGIAMNKKIAEHKGRFVLFELDRIVLQYLNDLVCASWLQHVVVPESATFHFENVSLFRVKVWSWRFTFARIHRTTCLRRNYELITHQNRNREKCTKLGVRNGVPAPSRCWCKSTRRGQGSDRTTVGM